MKFTVLPLDFLLLCLLPWLSDFQSLAMIKFGMLGIDVRDIDVSHSSSTII